MGDRLLLRRQRTQACAVSQTGNGRRRGRRHKEPKPTRRRGSCVAAPEKGKQLVRVGQRGASGGMQGGPRRGRSPITGPALPPAAQAAQTKIKKSPRARRAQQTPRKGQARFLCPLNTRRAGGQNNIKRKTAVPAGYKSYRSEDKPCFFCLETPTAKNPRPPRRLPKRRTLS